MNTQKTYRLKTFLESPLAEQLWKSNPHEVAEKFFDIWQNLARIMGQKTEDKTISFAMKCLGISLLMVKEYKFDFTSIPIPVDLRVVRFTTKTKIANTENPQEIQDIWHDILSMLQLTYPNLTMIHLDSLIWQIASLKDYELLNYFENIKIPEIGNKLVNYINESKPDLKQIDNSKSKKRILIIFPCSGRKKRYKTYENFTINEEKKTLDLITDTKSLLITGRKGLSNHIDFNSEPMAALYRYDGVLYNSSLDFRDIVKDAYLKKDVYVLIMSGAYGILTPSERIFYYNKKMDAKYWNLHRLPNIIENFIIVNKITHIFGFFSKTTDYMKIMYSIDWLYLKEKTSLKLAKTYYIDFQSIGGAQVIVPQITGALITSFIKSDFNKEDFYTNPFNGQVVNFINHLDEN